MARHCGRPADARPTRRGDRPTGDGTVTVFVRLLLVVNAFASSVTARNTVVIHQILSRGNTVQIVETSRRGHATRFAQDAASKGVDAVVAFGGDGTLNEVATGVAETHTALAVLPGGSTNVFARTLGLPNDPVAAAKELVPALAAASISRVGLGAVNGRYFCFHTGVGYDAAVVREVEKRASVKRWMGHPLFVYAGLKTWFTTYDRRHPHFSVSMPGASTIRDGYFTVVLNTSPYTYLGNRALDLSRHARLDRGLVVVTFRSLAAVPFLATLTRILRGRPIKPGSTVDEHHDVSALEIDAARPFPYQVDGDYLGETRRLRFEHRPSVLDLVLPLAGASGGATGRGPGTAGGEKHG
jgi:diacylglycerol kinase family enzyme